VFLRQPLGEGGEQLLASCESGFLEIGSGLEPGVPLERRAELMDCPAAEPDADGFGAGCRRGHDRKVRGKR
jgi:hypothetical protein